MLLISPVLLATAVAVKFHDGGPVLFRQTRIGRDGRPFSCLKFRSMVIDAERLLSDLEVNHERSSVLFKMVDDPRVTRPGKLIRRLSIDELPQLWNVLRGQMSLVGPRPPLPHEAASYGSDMRRRLRVRPGMTGLWQVSGRSRPQLGRDRAPGPLLRRQLVDGPGPQHPGAHRVGRARLARRLLGALPLLGDPRDPPRPDVTGSRGVRLLREVASR